MSIHRGGRVVETRAGCHASRQKGLTMGVPGQVAGSRRWNREGEREREREREREKGRAEHSTDGKGVRSAPLFCRVVQCSRGCKHRGQIDLIRAPRVGRAKGMCVCRTARTVSAVGSSWLERQGRVCSSWRTRTASATSSAGSTTGIVRAGVALRWSR